MRDENEHPRNFTRRAVEIYVQGFDDLLGEMTPTQSLAFYRGELRKMIASARRLGYADDELHEDMKPALDAYRRRYLDLKTLREQERIASWREASAPERAKISALIKEADKSLRPDHVARLRETFRRLRGEGDGVPEGA